MKILLIIIFVFVSGLFLSGCAGGIVYSGTGYYNDGFSYYSYPAYPYYYAPPVYHYDIHPHPHDWARGHDYDYHYHPRPH